MSSDLSSIIVNNYDTIIVEFSILSPKDFSRILVLYKASFSILETLEKVCVAIFKVKL